VSRSAGVAVIALLVLIGGLTGCHRSPGRPAPVPAASSTRHADPPVLRDAVLVNGELPGWDFGDVPSFTFTRPPARPGTCQPIDDVGAAQYATAPVARVTRLALAISGPADASGIDIDLAVFPGAAAEQLFSALRTALAACRSGYAGPKITYKSVTEVSTPAVGDGAVAFHLDGDLTDEDLTVVRHGATLLVFNAYTLNRNLERVPDELIAAQLAKLVKAGF
jgi:hypothetical protein